MTKVVQVHSYAMISTIVVINYALFCEISLSSQIKLLSQQEETISVYYKQNKRGYKVQLL